MRPALSKKGTVRWPAEERRALCSWARSKYPRLVRSKYASVVWGRGGRWEDYGATFWPRGSGWHNAGVRIVAGEVVVENYRRREVARLPLAAVAVQVVALLSPPGWAEWTVTDGVGLLAYADWLDERGESGWAARIRWWGTEAMNNVESMSPQTSQS